MPYRYLKRTFYIDLYWLWIVQFILYIGVVTAYIMIPGKEIVYAIYIPLDIVLTISLGAFYYYTYKATKREN